VSVGSAAAVDLTSLPRYLPYESLPIRGFTPTPNVNFYTGDCAALMDIDGDGYEEFILSHQGYLAARKYDPGNDITFYQKNVPPKFMPESAHHGAAALLPCADLNGDGQDDLIAWSHTVDRSHWRFWIMNPATGETHWEFDLPGGEDVRPDGQWDGNYYAVGTIGVTGDDTEIRAVVIGCTVGYDRYGRGMMAVDPRDGRILWRYECGPNPFRTNTRLVDLDGDGQPEIVFVGRSPANLDGEPVNGFSDDETRLFVLDRQGRLQWTRHLGGWYGNGELDLGDIDGDGLPEILTTTRTTPAVWGEMVIWDHTGRDLIRQTDEAQYSSTAAATSCSAKTANNSPCWSSRQITVSWSLISRAGAWSCAAPPTQNLASTSIWSPISCRRRASRSRSPVTMARCSFSTGSCGR